MKVYVHYTPEGGEEITMKITLPRKWKEGPTENIKETFVDAFLAKHKDKPALDCATCHLETSAGRKLASDAVVSSCITHQADLYVKPGPSPAVSDAKPAPAPAPAKEASSGASAGSGAASGSGAGDPHEGMVRCKNYGCQKWYVEADNTDSSCKHHASPPLFRDKKTWPCCDAQSWDWDEFMAFEGCTVSKHTTVSPGAMFSASPTVAAVEAAANASASKIMSIDDFDKANPDAVSAASSAAALVARGPPKPKPRSDGKAKCVRNGCQKEFVVAENAEGVCTYHVGTPVFHDTAKYWSCCPERKAYEFEKFLQVAGCATGKHDDGSEEA